MGGAVATMRWCSKSMEIRATWCPLIQLIDSIIQVRATAIPGTGGPEIPHAWRLLDDEEETVLPTLIDQNVGDPRVHLCSGVISPHGEHQSLNTVGVVARRPCHPLRPIVVYIIPMCCQRLLF